VTELLLLSNSRAPGMAFLEHATDAIGSVLGDRARIGWTSSTASAAPSATASPTWAPAPARTWPARRSAPPTTCRSSSRPRCRRSGWSPSSWIRTTSIPRRAVPTRARPVSSGSRSSSRRTTCRSWGCARAPGSGLAARRRSWAASARDACSAGASRRPMSRPARPVVPAWHHAALRRRAAGL